MHLIFNHTGSTIRALTVNVISVSCLLLIVTTQLISQQSWCTSRYDESGKADFIAATSHLQNNTINTRSVKWIPVVVHVVTKAPEIFTYARVLHQIDILNADFGNRNENMGKLDADLRSLTGDTGLRFCLAVTDPEGNPTNGITYTQTDIDNIALERDFNTGRYIIHYDEFGKKGWDPARYLNIWIGEFGNGILGYGSLPGTAPYPEEIGIVMDPAYFGAFGNGVTYFDRGHSLTHEVGHFFGLIHIWGDDDGCDGTDLVDDTPNAAGFYTGCPQGVQMSCGEKNMYQNFMDLTDDRCLAAFTKGQGMRMEAIIGSFYPSLPMDGPCRQLVSDFSSWWDQLQWTYDSEVKEYIVYHPNIFAISIDLDIYNVEGRLVMSDVLEGQSSFLIDLDAVPGIYFVSMIAGGEQHVRKIAVY